MARQIIKIDEDLCVGCGLCVKACHQEAIAVVDGKARLIRDDYCDGLGNCLPNCPTGAISFETREALEFNKDEVKKHKEMKIKKEKEKKAPVSHGGCPGSRMMEINPKTKKQGTDLYNGEEEDVTRHGPSMLRQWPVQIQLIPFNAPYFSNADLLIAADCTAYACSDIHSFMKDKITLIGCPKLDDVDYSNKLTEILRTNNINSITVIRMSVPCCGGLVQAVKSAIINSENLVPWRVVTISTDGTVLEDTK